MDMITSGINRSRTMIHSVEKAKEAVQRVMERFQFDILILASRKGKALTAAPLTRRDLYDRPCGHPVL